MKRHDNGRFLIRSLNSNLRIPWYMIDHSVYIFPRDAGLGTVRAKDMHPLFALPTKYDSNIQYVSNALPLRSKCLLYYLSI